MIEFEYDEHGNVVKESRYNGTKNLLVSFKVWYYEYFDERNSTKYEESKVYRSNLLNRIVCEYDMTDVNKLDFDPDMLVFDTFQDFAGNDNGSCLSRIKYIPTGKYYDLKNWERVG